MTENASQFVGSIPENYDQGLGPYIFHDYAEDLACRAGASDAGDVLELAAGTGILSRKLRDALPSQARLVVTDLNPPMLDVAASKFAPEESVEFKPADAMALPFEDSSFDFILCQFGVMFFPDKVAAFQEAGRVLRPGGTYLFNAWSDMPANPFSEIVYHVTAQFFPDDPPGFYRVPFSYSDRDAVAADMAAGGLRDIEFETLAFDRDVESWAQFARGLVFGNPLIEEIQNRGTADPEEVMQAVLSALRGRWGDEPATMPLEATIYSARAS